MQIRAIAFLFFSVFLIEVAQGVPGLAWQDGASKDVFYTPGASLVTTLHTNYLYDPSVQSAVELSITAPPGLVFFGGGCQDGALSLCAEYAGVVSAAASGIYTVVLRATDCEQTADITLTFRPNLSGSGTLNPVAVAGSPYSSDLSLSGGVAPFFWSVTGSLPAGLVLNPATGLVSGTPTTPGVSSFTLTAVDSIKVMWTSGVQVITVYGPLSVTTTSLPDLTVSTSTSQALTSSGGTAPKTWSIASGSLPAGLSLNAGSGIITGIPSTPGTANFTAQIACCGAIPGLRAFTLAVHAQASAVTVSASSVIFTSVKGGAQAGSQTLGLTSPQAGASYVVTAANLPAWLSLDKTAGTLPDSLVLSVNGSQLAIGEYTYTFSISETPVTVTLRVVKPEVVLSISSLFFLRTGMEEQMAPRSVVLSANGDPVTYTATSVTSSGNWLSLSNAAGTLPNSLTVSVNPQGLAAGEYTGTITLHFGGLTTETVTLPVTLRLPALLVALQPSSSANAQADFSNGQLKIRQTTPTPPPPSNLMVNSTTSSQQLYQASANTTSGGNWLRVFPASGITPAEVTVSTDGAGLAPGTYTGTVSIDKSTTLGSLSLDGAGGTAAKKAQNHFFAAADNTVPSSAFTLNVSLTVGAANTSGLTAAPASLSVQSMSGDSLALHQTVEVSGGAGPYYLTKSSPAWMSLSSTGGTLPGSFQVRVDPRGLAAGIHSGTVSITAAGIPNSPLLLPVSVTIRSRMPSIVLDSYSLLLTGESGSAVPTSSPVRVGNSGDYDASFNVSTSASWLSSTPSSGVAPATIGIRANTSKLAPGVYNGTVSVSAQDTVAVIQVRLEVLAKPALLTIGGPLTFRATALGADPGPQVVYLSASSRHVAFSVETNAPWLQASSANTRTPANLRITAASAAWKLAPGTYHATVKIAALDATNSGLEVPVTLIIDQNAPQLTIPGVTGLGSRRTGPIAPGLYLSLAGLQLPLVTAEALTLQPGFIPAQIAGVQVLFDGKPAPVLKVTAEEVIVMAPYELAGQTVTLLQVAYLDKLSEPVTLPVVPVRPEVAAIDAMRTTFARHADGAPVSSNAPTQSDNVITLAVTGLGATAPRMESFKMHQSAAIAGFAQPFSVSIGGQAAEVIWAGPMPGQAPGLIQLCVRVPRLVPGPAEVRVHSGPAVSQAGVEISVR